MTPRRELERWWHWVGGEQPDALEAWRKASTVLSTEARYALVSAAEEIAERAGREVGRETPIDMALDNHFEALRDLSLALVDALEAMRARVPEASGWKETTVTTGWIRPEVTGFGKPLSATLYDAAEQMRAQNQACTVALAPNQIQPGEAKYVVAHWSGGKADVKLYDSAAGQMVEVD